MFFKNISADFRRITSLVPEKSWIARAAYPFTCPGFHALIWYRLIQANRRWRIPVLFYLFAIVLRIFNTFTQWFWGICIASNSEIGPGLYIAHHGQIFVGVKTMGENCTLGHNVTIGRTEKEPGYPKFGDNVYIAPGAMVIGKIEIGDNVKIGPNTVVRRSVPANSVVVATPPRVIRLTSKEEWAREKDNIDEKSTKDQSTSVAKGHRDGGSTSHRERRDGSRQRNNRNRRRKPQSGQTSQDQRTSNNSRPSGNRNQSDNRQRENPQSTGKRSGSGSSENKARPRHRRDRNSRYNREHRGSSDPNTQRDRKDNAQDPKVEKIQDITPATSDMGEELDSLKLTDSSTRPHTAWPGKDQETIWTEDMEGEPLDD